MSLESKNGLNAENNNDFDIEQAEETVVNTHFPKRKKKVIITTIIASFVASLVIGSAIYAWDYVENFFMKLFCSPEGYYQYIEEKNIDLVSELFSEFVGSTNLDSANSKSKHNFRLKIHDTETVGEIANRYFNVDKTIINRYSDVKLSTKVVSGDFVQQNEIILLCGGKTQFNYSLCLDARNNLIYLDTDKTDGKKYVLFNLNDESETLADISRGMAFVPGFSQSKNIFNAFFNSAVETVDGVEIESTTIFANGLSQDCTRISYELREEDVKDILRALLEQFKVNKDIESVIKNTSENLYSKCIKLVDAMLADVDKIKLTDFAVRVNTYVDAGGRIIGRKIESLNTTDSFYYYITNDCNVFTKNGKVALECGVNGVEISGDGYIQDGMIDFDLNASYKGYDIATIDVDDIDGRLLLNGYIKCNMEIFIPTEAHDIIKSHSGLDQYALDILFNSKFSFKLDNNKSTANNTVLWEIDSKPTVEISTDKTKDKGVEIILPQTFERKKIKDYFDWNF